MSAPLRELPMLLHDAALFDERQPMLLCRPIGGEAPRAGRKPHRLGTFGSRFLHVCFDGTRSAEHDDEIDRTWDIGQARVRWQAGDISTIRANRNDVVPFMREISRDLVTVTIGTRAGADDRDRSGAL
jgi:hypothetical protein